jgi:hypothetical protein
MPSENSVYPGAQDTFSDQEAKQDVADKSIINKLQNAIVAMQSEFGIDPAGSCVDLKTRLAVLLALDGAVAKGTAFPTNPAPIDGQLFYRTDQDTLYVYDGGNWDAVAITNAQLFTANGTFTPPAGVTEIFVTMVGGGGGGGGGNGGSGGGGGGGSGAHVIKMGLKVTPASNYTVTIGAKGTKGAAGGSGTAGGDTSIVHDLGTLTCPGGGGGTVTTAGAGGAGSGAYAGANSIGDAGGLAGTYVVNAGAAGGVKGNYGGGGGASSPFDLGGAGGARSSNANDAAGGFGGGGGAGGGDASGTGGDGAQGFVYVEW